MLYLSKAKGRGNEEVRKKNGHMQPVRESKLTKDSIPNKQKPHTCTHKTCVPKTLSRICTHSIFKVIGLKHVKDNALLIFH